MGHKHIHLIVQDLCIDVEVICDAIVEDGVPANGIFLQLRDVEFYAVAPKMVHCSHGVLQLVFNETLSDWIFFFLFNELQVELMKIYLHIDALIFPIIIF